jgi:hypothetical protein
LIHQLTELWHYHNTKLPFHFDPAYSRYGTGITFGAVCKCFALLFSPGVSWVSCRVERSIIMTYHLCIVHSATRHDIQWYDLWQDSHFTSCAANATIILKV